MPPRCSGCWKTNAGARAQKAGPPAPLVPGGCRAPPLPSWQDFEAQLHEVRAHGVSRSEGEIVPGVNAMSAPVFDHTGAIVLAITAIGPAGIFGTAWDGEIARALKNGADAVSQRLGAVPRRGGLSVPAGAMKRQTPPLDAIEAFLAAAQARAFARPPMRSRSAPPPSRAASRRWNPSWAPRCSTARHRAR